MDAIFFELPKEVREKRKATLTYPAAQKQEELQTVKATLEAEDMNIRSFAIYSHKRLVLQWTDELKKTTYTSSLSKRSSSRT